VIHDPNVVGASAYSEWSDDHVLLEDRISETDLSSKAEGVAFALRNATDYFSASQTRNVSQRVLNLYYDTMAFAFAEMLASPAGPTSLAQIEEATKRGHGLYTIDGLTRDVEDLVVGIMRAAFSATISRSWVRTCRGLRRRR
jgi:hypothetical protein